MEKLYNEILEQIQAEKKISEAYGNKKRQRWKKQFKLLYNERKREDTIGDETTWSISDTIISSLQEDKLLHEFRPTEIWDYETCELLNNVMEVDWNKMKMDDIKNIASKWAVYVGRCVIDCSEISEKTKTVSPRFVNPFLEYVDPSAICMHWIWESSQWWARWYGYVLPTTKWEIKAMLGYDKNIIWESEWQKALKQIRKLSGDNLEVWDNSGGVVLIWYTKYSGISIRVMTDLYVSEMYSILELGDEFPLFDPSIDIGEEWYPRSILDMVEDKHRNRANIANTAAEITYEKLNPITLAKTGFPLELLERAEGWDVIEVEDTDSVRFLEKQGVSQEAGWLLNILDQQAQEVTGMPDIQQGVQMDDARTASELSILSSASKRRYGRISRYFAVSFVKFYEIWYEAYQKYWTDTKIKSIQVSGVYGPKWRNITKKDITLKSDLDIRVESKIISEQIKIQKINSLIKFHQIAINDPSYQAREWIKMIGKTMDITTQELNLLFPKSVDELEAEEENKLLVKWELTDWENKVLFDINQDHDAHIREHMKEEMTKAMEIHIQAHYEAKRLIRNKKDMLMQMWYHPNDNNAITKTNTPENITQLTNVPLWLPTV